MFEEKVKEPVLSEYMQDCIERSRQDSKTDAHVDYVNYLKNGIMKDLINNPDILRALHYERLLGTPDELNGDQYKDVCIFPYMRLPDLKAEAKNFICFEVEERHGNDNTIEYYVTFRCIAHKDDVKTDWDIPRQDLLSAIIETRFSWSTALGKSFRKRSEYTLIANNEYYCREKEYVVTLKNNDYHKMNGRQINGYRPY